MNPNSSLINDDIYSRLELETAKYFDIGTIFKKIKDNGQLKVMYDLFYSIFYNEHEYTLKQLRKISQQNIEGFNFHEHYKMNAHIFKSNLQLILNILVDDLWVHFTSSALTSNNSGNASQINQSHSVESSHQDVEIYPKENRNKNMELFTVHEIS
jgi:hypothetical protein